jgi:hypothetical protein
MLQLEHWAALGERCRWADRDSEGVATTPTKQKSLFSCESARSANPGASSFGYFFKYIHKMVVSTRSHAQFWNKLVPSPPKVKPSSVSVPKSTEQKLAEALAEIAELKRAMCQQTNLSLVAPTLASSS